ncbi:HAD family phosphatase [Gemmatimonas aurantiaca]|nr:HAD family phosphatase [Gemmatimonas aurantiaca]
MSENNNKTGKYILFDAAGVLVTFRADLRTERMEKLCDLSPDKINSKLFTNPDSPGIAFDRGEILASDFFDLCCEIMGQEATQEFAAKFRHAYCDIFEARTEMGELLKELAEHHTIWLCSNTNTWHLEKMTEVCSYFAYFDFNVSSHKAGFIKPEPEIFEKALKRAGVDPSEMIFIDDRQENVAAASAQGINAILFTSVAELKAQLATLTSPVTT